MKNNASLFVLLGLLLATTDLRAQNFDGDSVYYTPISKIEKKAAHKNIFKDTIKNDQRFSYFFNLQVGNLIGCTDCSVGKQITFTSSTTHGVAIGKKLRVGGGIGFDSYYNWHTMPLFGSVSWDLIGTKNTSAIFVQLNSGWSEAWLNKSPWDDGLKNTTGGRTSTASIGYRIKYHDVKISLSVGSKFQRVVAYYEYPTYYYRSDGTMVQGTPNTESIQQDMSRLTFALTIGWK